MPSVGFLPTVEVRTHLADKPSRATKGAQVSVVEMEPEVKKQPQENVSVDASPVISNKPVAVSKPNLEVKPIDVKPVSDDVAVKENSDTKRPSDFLVIFDSRTHQDYVIPINNNSIKAVDIGKIQPPSENTNREQQYRGGLKVFDRGFVNTACVESAITLIDGERGQIHFRGYDIGYLFENHEYEEVVFLLMYGNLPSAEEAQAFRRGLVAELKAPKVVVDTIHAFPADSMAFPMILAGLAAFAALDEGTNKLHTQHKPYFLGNMKNADAANIRALAAMAATLALVYCHKRGTTVGEPDLDGSFIANVLKMMGKPDEDKEIERCLSRLWILYADHEMTNSTAAFLHASSTLTDPISSSIAAMVSAYGPLHGGAIDLAYKGFEMVGSVHNVPYLIKAVKAKQQRLFGYGHRIYKTVDPRIKFIRQMIDTQVKEKKRDVPPALQIALAIDDLASNDEYFTSRKLSANADLYGALLYTALGFESDIVVALASMSRMPGVLAHWRESMQQNVMLWRPQQLYTGTSEKSTA